MLDQLSFSFMDYISRLTADPILRKPQACHMKGNQIQIQIHDRLMLGFLSLLFTGLVIYKNVIHKDRPSQTKKS
jgi:hypothetical protein